MVVDVGVVKKHIKPKADITLYNMRKVDLIEYIRTLEHNYNVAVSFNENQAKYIESLGITKRLTRCMECMSWCELEDTGGCGYCNHACWFIADAEPPITGANDFCSYGERKDNG